MIAVLIIATVLSLQSTACRAFTGNAAAQNGWTVAEEAGVLWLRDTAGNLLYSKGVNCVNGWDEYKDFSRPAYYWGNYFTAREQWRQSVEQNLRAWGFNTRGAWSDNATGFSLPLTVQLDLGRMAKLHWFDPFDPAMQEKTFQTALTLTAALRTYPGLIGYFTDNEAGWWNAPLFQWYLKEPWTNHTKQVLWELLIETYRADWSGLLRDFVPAKGIGSFEDLKKQGARLSLRPGGAGIRVINRFTYLCSRRYYGLVQQALRRAHPGALIMGDRLPLYYNQDAARAMADTVDVISTNYNVDVPDGWVAPWYFEGLYRLSGKKPVLVSEFFFAARENRSANRNNGHLMTVATQAERAVGAAQAVKNFAGFPNVVGAHWFQLYDEPSGGRRDGEDYNMGLIDIKNRPYEELTASLSAAHQGLDALHRASSFACVPGEAGHEDEARPFSIKKADCPISLKDETLIDWKQKRKTRLSGFKSPEPYVPFGDVHMAWTAEGLYLFCLAKSYYDPNILSFRGAFPHSEAFQLHLNIVAEGASQHYAVFLVPKKSTLFRNEQEIMPRLVRMDRSRKRAVAPSEGKVQQIAKPLPHIAFEVFLPAKSLGLPELTKGQNLRLNVWAVSYFREHAMTFAGTPAQETTDYSAFSRPVILE